MLKKYITRLKQFVLCHNKGYNRLNYCFLRTIRKSDKIFVCGVEFFSAATYNKDIKCLFVNKKNVPNNIYMSSLKDFSKHLMSLHVKF